MSQTNCNIKTAKDKVKKEKKRKRNFKHLSQVERGQIFALLQEGKSVAYIAKVLGRSRTTIYNEIKRGTTTQIKGKKIVKIYLADRAQAEYEKNRQRSVKPLKIEQSDEQFKEYLIDAIKNEGWSIEQTISRAYLEERFEILPCSKTVYNYIDQGILEIKNIDLPLKVRRKGTKKKERQNKKIYGASISQRPKYIEKREEFGHWEGDTVQGKKKKGEVILSLVERMTRYSIFIKVRGKDNESIKQGLRKVQKDYEEKKGEVFKSITFDNGSEFSDMKEFEEETDIYYAHPYSAYERGTNERHNGLLRRFIPKSKDISKYSEEKVQEYTDMINAKPRKILGYYKPEELFDKELDKIYKVK